MTTNSRLDPNSLTRDELVAALEAKVSECDAAQRKIMALKREQKRNELAFDSAVAEINNLQERLLQWAPLHQDSGEARFAFAMISEMFYQTAKWGEDHDKNKTAEDWLYVLDYLSKALSISFAYGSDALAREKCVNLAAFLGHWYNHLTPKATD